MTCRVKWGDDVSEYFSVPLGTKQGGISSPKFFSLYVDGFVSELRRLGVGCHLVDGGIRGLRSPIFCSC